MGQPGFAQARSGRFLRCAVRPGDLSAISGLVGQGTVAAGPVVFYTAGQSDNPGASEKTRTMTEKTICVTVTEYVKATAIFEAVPGWRCVSAPYEETGLVEVVRAEGAWAVIVGVDRYADALYEVLPRGGVIARFGVGHDGIDKARATAAGLIVTNTPGVLDDSVAEHALWLMGAWARQVAGLDAAMKSDRWTPQVGLELRGRTLLVVGCGQIGRRVARIAHFGFGMHVLGYDVGPLDAGELKTRYGVERLCPDLTAALGEADIVSVHLPSNAATRHFVNADFLAAMAPQALLVNTARGAVVDERALYAALSGGQIAGAALDVFETEPYAPVAPEADLRRLANVVLTPHVGSGTSAACERMARRSLANVAAAARGDYDALDCLNPEVLEGR